MLMPRIVGFHIIQGTGFMLIRNLFQIIRYNPLYFVMVLFKDKVAQRVWLFQFNFSSYYEMLFAQEMIYNNLQRFVVRKISSEL